jgi:hypothetical protein
LLASLILEFEFGIGCPPTRKMKQVTVETYCEDSLSGFDSMVLTTATSSEPDSGPGKGDRPDDIQGFILDSPETSGELRAERLGSGAGRMYTLGYTCYDTAGNTSSCDNYVLVPHDMGK